MHYEPSTFRQFTAQDKDGKTYTLVEEQTYKVIFAAGVGRHVLPSIKKLKTSDGLHVNRIDKGQYAILCGPTLASNDPTAP